MRPEALLTISTPAYVADMAAIRRNLAVAERLKQETGCKLLLATKAFSMFALFPEFARVMDGTTASGLYEAQLGHRHFGGEVHAYSPAYDAHEIESLVPICQHIYFNSASQLARYAPLFREAHGDEAQIGLRLNPQFSQVTNASIYDPSSPGSRFGMKASEITDALMQQVDCLHVHNLCENMAADSVALIEHLRASIPHLLAQVSSLNLGGGHYMTHPDYDLQALIEAVNELQDEFNLRVTIESGGTWVYDAGWLVAEVLDILPGTPQIAILNTSATCHMPDVLEMPYRPHVIGDVEAGAHPYQFTGRTCLTGDIIGNYRFDAPLSVGDKVFFTDMMQYSMVKNTTFNGVPLPDIGVLEEDGSYRVITSFSYDDFERRLS